MTKFHGKVSSITSCLNETLVLIFYPALYVSFMGLSRSNVIYIIHVRICLLESRIFRGFFAAIIGNAQCAAWHGNSTQYLWVE